MEEFFSMLAGQSVANNDTGVVDTSQDENSVGGQWLSNLESDVANVGSSFQSGVSGILPSQTMVWFYILAVIIILVLVAYISREVIGA